MEGTFFHTLTLAAIVLLQWESGWFKQKPLAFFYVIAPAEGEIPRRS